MSRIQLTDNSKRWFDSEKATLFEARYKFHHRRYEMLISMATDDTSTFQELYRTQGGSWILSEWYKDDQNAPIKYLLIDSTTAIKWLRKQDIDFDEKYVGPEECLEIH